jgi:hypothetical protein
VKIAWVVLIISALTDFVITAGTAFSSAMVATGQAQIPNQAVILLAIVGGCIQAARTIQQALKTTPDTVRALKGEDR